MLGLLFFAWALFALWLQVGTAMAGYRGVWAAAQSIGDWIRSLLGQ